MAEATGFVRSVNQTGTGIQLDSGEWFNYSNRTPVATKPQRGHRVTVTFDPQARQDGNGFNRWITGIEILDGGAIQTPKPGPRFGGKSPEERLEIKRMSALRSAAAFLGSRQDAKSSDVTKVAEYFVKWMESRDG